MGKHELQCCAVTCWNVFTACPGMEARFGRGLSKPCQGACPRSGDLQVDLDRVCARATLPVSVPFRRQFSDQRRDRLGDRRIFLGLNVALI